VNEDYATGITVETQISLSSRRQNVGGRLPYKGSAALRRRTALPAVSSRPSLSCALLYAALHPPADSRRLATVLHCGIIVAQWHCDNCEEALD